jgi:hypothetical protein
MAVLGVVAIFLLIIVLGGLVKYQIATSFPVVRPMLESTWAMHPGASVEGFMGERYTVQSWLPSPEVLTKPTVGDCPYFLRAEGAGPGTLENAAEYKGGGKSPYTSYDLLPGGLPEPRIASGPTAAQCYKKDWSRGLELSGSYAQRTNNYRQNYPDSCSAPNHDLVLDFYKPTPTEGARVWKGKEIIQ